MQLRYTEFEKTSGADRAEHQMSRGPQLTDLRQALILPSLRATPLSVLHSPHLEDSEHSSYLQTFVPVGCEGLRELTGREVNKYRLARSLTESNNVVARRLTW